MKQFLNKLVEKLQLDSTKVKTCIEISQTQGTFLIQEILQAFPEHEKMILDAYCQAYRMKYVDLSKRDIPENIIGLINRETAKKYNIVPIDRAGNNIIIAIDNPHDLKVLDDLRFKTGFTPQPVFAKTKDIKEALDRYYLAKGVAISNIQGGGGKKREESRHVINEKVDDPIVKLVNQVLMQCVQRGASDIHIEPYESFLRIRLRIDGSLIEIARPPIGYKDQLSSRVKILCNMNIAERRIPQDGGIRTTIDSKPIDFRVSSLPTIHGEKIVMRLLDKSALQVDMTKLGFEQDDFEKFKNAIYKPFGMVLVTGPTGSGKTTTLYSALQELNRSSGNITTAEDPVEFNIEGINQVQVDDKISLGFSEALKAFLRQDPDIIMVGEIRDLQTGEIGIKAALTGHLVLSTLHTNNAADTIIRLVDLGLEPFNITSSLNAVIAQRLVRKVCPKCREPYRDDEALKQLGFQDHQIPQITLMRGKGCDHCSGSGYRGRVAVHEVMEMTTEIRAAIMRHASAADLKRLAIQQGMRTMRMNALRKLIRGETDIAEVYKNTASDVDQPNSTAA